MKTTTATSQEMIQARSFAALRMTSAALRRTRWAAALLLVCAMGPATGPASAMDHVVLKRDNAEVALSGRVVVEAQDGGLLLQTPDGALWTIPPEELVKHTSDKEPFAPYSREEFKRRLLARLPQGFDVYETTHYMVFHTTGRAYAQWCASLFERLYAGFSNYWVYKGLKVAEPEFPLAAIVFSDRRSYEKFARSELGDAVESIIGYYSLQTNRMTMYDLTGAAANGSPARRATSASINQILAQPQAAQTVATIVHEATHQIAFNCGMHTRYSDCPLWFTEGLAMFFENPDLRSAKGWRTIGGVNESRMRQFESYLASRPADSLATLIGNDKRLRDPKQALDAYAEAWALTYFLIQRRHEQYGDYLKMLSAKKPLISDTPEERLERFRKAFGDLTTLDAEFLRYLQRVR